MKKGDYVRTPRFCTVKIEKVFRNKENAYKAGFKEPTHYTHKNNDGYDVLGRQIDMYHMEFAAVKL